MIYNFDQIIDRKNTNSFKWDANKKFFGREDVLPFWVADMDFACAPQIIEALQKRMQHPVFGYSVRSQSYFESIINWVQRRHNWSIKKEWITFCSPGVIQAINMLVLLLSNPKDEILLHLPAYKPLINVITKNNRIIKKSKLVYFDQSYSMDLQDLKNQITSKTKLLILCSPHNPSGRVWKKEELLALGNICIENNIKIISDEIHSDFIYKNHIHFPIGSLSEDISMNSVTCISASKTFNISGLQLATLIIPNENIRKLYNEAVDTAQIGLGNTFGEIAVEAAYTNCEPWLEQLIDYVTNNFQFLKNYLEKYLPKIKIIEPEGTYLVWLDMSELGKSSSELNELFIHNAGVALYQGQEFGDDQNGFFRINIACPKSILEEGLNKIKIALS